MFLSDVEVRKIIGIHTEDIQVKANNPKINFVAQELNGLYDNIQNQRFELQ